MAIVADTNSCVCTKQCNGGQPVHKSAGEQHHQQQQQQHQLNNLQRQCSGVCRSSSSDGSCIHWGGTRQLFDWTVWRSDLKRYWYRWWNLQKGRAMRIAEVVQDLERFRTQGGSSRSVVSRCSCVSGYGYGRNAMPISWCNWQASHGLVATKS